MTKFIEELHKESVDTTSAIETFKCEIYCLYLLE